MEQQIVNLDYINAIGQNNDEFLLKMINTFLKECPLVISELEEAVLNENWEASSKLAHRFVTSVRFMGMADIALKLKELENNTKQGINLEDSINLFIPIKQACIQAIEELETQKRLIL